MRRQPACTRSLNQGVSLVEALIALVVMSFGMLALVGLQATMRLNADAAKQRSEAVRIAQADIERWRAFSSLASAAGITAFADLVSTPLAMDATGYTTNTSFKLNRSIADSADTPLKQMRIWVQWLDRTGGTQQVELNTLLAGVDPALSGALAKKPHGAPSRLTRGRHPGIPSQAHDMGSGSSAFKPVSGGSAVWMFNNVTGAITRFCSVLDPAAPLASLSLESLVSCVETQAALLSGHVRFAEGSPMNAALAENPDATALNLDIAITLTSSGHPDPAYVCFDDAPTTAVAAALVTTVTYHCAVQVNSEGVWSGKSSIEPRAFTDAGAEWDIDDHGDRDRKICRYTTLAGNTGANLAHPLNYVGVKATEPLPHQNFLVIPANRNCPSDVAANPAAGDFVNSNTRLHQPS